ncbi:sporulation membrane protein YtaF [Shimazuella kribbensis]|uniref:sporulation membrane protein YtaF n=1 Tax=Shimazuella kribbensis TaxID=139808 RepID=UPI0004042471|nr:sporulation membrane protein YtaF [Shimazuella kribbensis]
MEWLTIILIGIAANLDNLGVGVAYGVQSTKIPVKSNFIIAGIGAVITYFSVTLGSWIGNYIDPDLANIGGGIILFGIGAWTIWTDWQRITLNDARQKSEEGHYLQKILDCPERADTDNNKVISSKESLLLGIALSLNCFGVGIGGGITGVSPVLSSIVVGSMSFCTMMIGIRMGIKLSYSWINRFASSIAGVLLVSMGLFEILM